MTKPLRLSVNIPFPGFYDSILSSQIDNEESQWCEYEAEESEYGEIQHPKELRLSESELGEMLWRFTNYGKIQDRIAREYVDAFDSIVSDDLGLKLELEYEEMTSPREYNFTTDRVFASAPWKVIRKSFARSKADDHECLAGVIAKRFTSYDGFISHYRNDLDSWLAKPLREWDHNELGTLLLACMKLAGVRDDLEYACFDYIGEGFYSAWESGVDWGKFDAARDEWRADKQAELAADDPEAMESLHYFCRDPRQLWLPLNLN